MIGARWNTAPLLGAAAGVILVTAALALGLWFLLSLSIRREADFDLRRVQDLSAMYREITAYYYANGHLPASADALSRAASRTFADPATGARYEYIVNNVRNYQLCAVFDRVSAGTIVSYPPEAAHWKHDKGRDCFDLMVLFPGQQ